MDRTLCCPSAPGERSSAVTGLVDTDGLVSFFGAPLDADPAFIDAAEQVGPANERFRFVAPCVASSCRNWCGTACGLPRRVLADLEHVPPLAPPACGIRHNCRWFAQHGLEVCSKCRYVVTAKP